MIRNNHWLRSAKIGARKGLVSHFPVQSKVKIFAGGLGKVLFAIDANAMLITLSVAKFFVHRLPLQELSVFLFN